MECGLKAVAVPSFAVAVVAGAHAAAFGSNTAAAAAIALVMLGLLRRNHNDSQQPTA